VRDRVDDLPPSTSRVVRQVGSTPATLRRWIDRGLIPQYEGTWTPTAVAPTRGSSHACDKRGHSLDDIRAASDSGRLAFGYTSRSCSRRWRRRTRSRRPRATPAWSPTSSRRSSRRWARPATAVERISESDLELLRYGAAVLAAGLPLVARLPLVRVYGQALAQIADAEVRLFTCTSTSRSCARASPGSRSPRRCRVWRPSCCRSPHR
jgi:adenylate cyclase